ncbi:MAG: hypothetical protein E6K52_00685 [Gammaproteobacteria bacterium]|nr:MAG: hypothetical protein E6K52_00685 [Gammaproteobacteria bacterium]
MKRYLLFPLRGAALLLVVSFTLGQVLAVRAGLLGIPLAVILVSWFFKYCFVLLDAIVAGEEEPPVLSVEMVNPLSEQRPLAQALLITAGVMLVGGLRKLAGEPAAMLCGALLTVALPASIAVLGITGNPFRAASPLALLALIRALGWHYALLNVAILTAAGLLAELAQAGAPDWVMIAAVQLLLLLTFALVGGAVYEHRLELAIDSRSKREREAERDQREHVLERNRVLLRAYANVRMGKLLEGWQEIQAWLTRHGQGEQALAEQRAVLEAASRWDDVRPADRLADDLIALLLAARETGQALEVLERRLASNPRFRPARADHTVRLAELASLAGKGALRRRLESEPPANS